MISSSGTRRSYRTLVLDRQEDKKLSPRLMELRKKIHEQDYLDNAILRIAQVISRKLIENPDELHLGEK